MIVAALRGFVHAIIYIAATLGFGSWLWGLL